MDAEGGDDFDQAEPSAEQLPPIPDPATSIRAPRATPQRMRRAWRGVIRGQLRSVIRRLRSLTNWNFRQPTDFPLFTSDEQFAVSALISDFEGKLGELRPR